MSKVNRNSPCPCGSGRKYKACCLGSGKVSDIRASQFWRIHDQMVPELLAFVSDKDGREMRHSAWVDFNGVEDVEPHDPTHPIDFLFKPWFLFSWLFETTMRGEGPFWTNITDLFVLANLEKLTTDEKEYILSVMGRPYSLYEVVSTDPGVSITLNDILRRIQFSVGERALSESVKLGEILYCATAEFRGARFSIGIGPYPLRPTSKLDVLELREWITKEIGTDKITDEDLFKFQDDIRFLYLDLMRGMLAPPTIQNTDGDPLVPHTLYFEIASADEAFHALKHLTEAANPDELLDDAVVKDGIVTKIEIPWLGGTERGREQLGGPVMLGLLKINDTKLIVEVNSYNRAETLRKIIEERLGDRAIYKRAKIESIESQLKETSGKRHITGSEILGKTASPSHDPAIRAALEENTRKHWDSWFDLPIPALGNVSPREASKAKKGRVLLESLLQEYENNSLEGNQLNPDISYLRHELGMK